MTTSENWRNPDDDAAAALADHPRIGERPRARSRSAAFSRAEQQAPDTDDPELAMANDAWTVIGRARTDADGRVTMLGPAALPTGRYRVTFDTGAYFAAQGTSTFYPEVVVVVELADPAAHYHVPLLMSPFAYSTYRGS